MKKINLDTIKQIFEQFDSEENEQYKNLMNGNSDDLPSCPFGIIACKFIEKNKLMIKELIPEIQNLLDAESFQNWIVQLEKDKAKEKLNAIINKLETRNNNELEKVYKENDIDLNSVDRQYNKYKLLTVDNNFEISISNIPKVHDKRLDIYLYINEIEEDFLQLLKELQEQEYISDLALRPEYINVSKDLQDLSIVLEEKEFGKIFSFENLGNPTITKLYSTDKYDNKLWIITDEENITFEELLEDFDIHNNSIVTQVIHLQYKKENSNYIIHHIDHEYIFYTEDEYIERENNPMQKGEAQARFKTFKVDNSKIPFILNDGSFFLYKVLDTYFVNKNLIKEYFQNILED